MTPLIVVRDAAWTDASGVAFLLVLVVLYALVDQWTARAGLHAPFSAETEMAIGQALEVAASSPFPPKPAGGDR